MDYIQISVWFLETLIPNFFIGWKRGGWYSRLNGRYISREWAMLIWFFWIIAANYLLYPLFEGLVRLVYVELEKFFAGIGVILFIIFVMWWAYAFIYKGEKVNTL